MQAVGAAQDVQIDPGLAAIIDVPRLRAWMIDTVAGFDGEGFSVRRLAGGSSNLTILIEQGACRYVLRRPPLGPYLPSAHDVAREFGFYRGLHGTAVPVPRTHGLCTDAAVLGAPFYVMDHVAGRVIETIADAERLAKGERRRFCETLAGTLAEIHRVDIEAAGLQHVAPRDGYMERQMRRWTGQWERLGPAANPTVGEIGRRLARAMPTATRTTIVHGDYRIGNVMTAPSDASRIVAVLDWEMATLGDPLADLGYMLIYWGAAYPHLEPGNAIPDLPGFMTEREMIAAYEHAGGQAANSIDFYKVLGWFKLAVMTQGFIARGQTALGESLARLERHRDALAVVALDTADRSGIAGLDGR